MFLESFERKKKSSPNFKVFFGQFVVEDPDEKKVLSNIGVVSEQDLVAWPTTFGSHIRVGISYGWSFENAGRTWPKGYRLSTSVPKANAGFSKWRGGGRRVT